MSGLISQKVVASKAGTIRDMLSQIRTLPLKSEEEFLADVHMVAAGESYLRRALEALLDWGRHVLAKGFGRPVAEYKRIPPALREVGVLSAEGERRMLDMAGYRNRMVHFYDEITPTELYGILTAHLTDVDAVVAELRTWLNANPDRVNSTL